jgi:hypothetical protein
VGTVSDPADVDVLGAPSTPLRESEDEEDDDEEDTAVLFCKVAGFHSTPPRRSASRFPAGDCVCGGAFAAAKTAESSAASVGAPLAALGDGTRALT